MAGEKKLIGPNVGICTLVSTLVPMGGVYVSLYHRKPLARGKCVEHGRRTRIAGARLGMLWFVVDPIPRDGPTMAEDPCYRLTIPGKTIRYEA
ncbi:hypothetical protein F4810DRAFT_714027 [Camillea tinctor]|nr:hypothetical protein F4810DRAFT_714027 [Camillea tinctor]